MSFFANLFADAEQRPWVIPLPVPVRVEQHWYEVGYWNHMHLAGLVLAISIVALIVVVARRR